MRIFLCRFLAFWSVMTCTASAAPLLCQKLIRPQSSIRFDASTNALSASGSFSDFAGRLAVDPGFGPRSRVDLSVNFQSIAFREQNSPMGLAELFVRAIPLTQVRFASSSVTRVAPNRLAVRGTLERGAVREPIEIPVEVLRSSVEGSHFRASLRGNRVAFPANIQGADVSGEVRFDLVFADDQNGRC